MSFPLEQFLSTVLLRIFPIQNLEPRTLLTLCDVGRKFLLGNDLYFGYNSVRCPGAAGSIDRAATYSIQADRRRYIRRAAEFR